MCQFGETETPNMVISSRTDKLHCQRFLFQFQCLSYFWKPPKTFSHLRTLYKSSLEAKIGISVFEDQR